MKLIGRFMSPFTRRVAVSARTLGLEFEHVDLSTMTDVDEIRRYNPMGRVPTVVLDDGTVLVDSAAIVDWLDEQVEPERRLVPVSGAARRDVLQLVSWATGAGDKAVVAHYELTRRPEDKIFLPAVESNVDQIRSAFGVLEKAAADGGWLVGDRMTQADIAAVIFLEFCEIVLADRLDRDDYPALGALCARAHGENPAFAGTSPR